jgi:hypothetical protein
MVSPPLPLALRRMSCSRVVAPDSIPSFARARAEANTIGPTDWLKQYALGVRLVDLILRGGAT